MVEQAPRPAVETRYVCGLAGEGFRPEDGSLLRPASDQAVTGVDLGSPFVDGDRLRFLFGDTTESSFVLDANNDSVATASLERAPRSDDACLELRFVTAEQTPGRPEWLPLMLTYRDQQAPLGALQVPGAGFSVGGQSYAVMPAHQDGPPQFFLDCAADSDCPGQGDRCLLVGDGARACFFGACPSDPPQRGDGCYSRGSPGLLATPVPGSEHVYEPAPSDKAAPAAVIAYGPHSGLVPLADFVVRGQTVYAFTRESIVSKASSANGLYLMRHQHDGVLQAPEYFAGCDGPDGACTAGAAPRWGDYAARRPLYDEDREVLGQSSVMYVEALERWVLIYGGELPIFLRTDLVRGGDGHSPYFPSLDAPGRFDFEAGVYLRTAEQPWGPWSEALRVYDPFALSDGYCDIMHASEALMEAAEAEYPGFRAECEARPAQAPMRAALEARGEAREFGAMYGTALLEPFSGLTGDGEALELRWIASTWRPYRVVVMRTRVELGELAGAVVR